MTLAHQGRVRSIQLRRWSTSLLAVAALLLGAACQRECDASSCPDGCCDAEGICWIENTNDTCGLGGAACQACTFAQTCTTGACTNTCNSTNCPDGCCNEHGNCQQPTSIGCGLNGASCVTCGSSQGCSAVGQCSTCGTFQAPCDGNEDCCLGYTCQYDPLFGEDRCQ